MEKRVCQNCGIEFEGNSNALYCSGKCRTAAFRNGNNNKITGLPDVKQENETDNDYSVSETTKNKTLIPVTVMLTQKAIENLEAKAESCGVELSKYIAVRSQMDENDNLLNENIINKQKDEIDELNIKLSFYQNGIGNIDIIKGGLFIAMTKEQKEFLISEFLESFDFIDESNSNTSKILKEIERDNKASGSIYSTIESTIGIHMISALFSEMEQRFIDECDVESDYFEDNSLEEQFKELV